MPRCHPARAPPTVRRPGRAAIPHHTTPHLRSPPSGNVVRGSAGRAGLGPCGRCSGSSLGARRGLRLCGDRCSASAGGVSAYAQRCSEGARGCQSGKAAAGGGRREEDPRAGVVATACAALAEGERLVGLALPQALPQGDDSPPHGCAPPHYISAASTLLTSPSAIATPLVLWLPPYVMRWSRVQNTLNPHPVLRLSCIATAWSAQPGSSKGNACSAVHPTPRLAPGGS